MNPKIPIFQPKVSKPKPKKVSQKDWILQYAEQESDSDDSLGEKEDSQDDPVRILFLHYLQS